MVVLITSLILLSWVYLSWTQRDNPRAKKIDREWQVLLLSGSFFTAAGLLVWRITSAEQSSVTIDVVATVYAIIGSILRALGIHALGQHFSWGSTPPKEIVHSGVYRYIRHPLIIGYVLQTGGMSIAGNGSYVIRTLPIICVIIAAWVQIRREEREIKRCFENY